MFSNADDVILMTSSKIMEIKILVGATVSRQLYGLTGTGLKPKLASRMIVCNFTNRTGLNQFNRIDEVLWNLLLEHHCLYSSSRKLMDHMDQRTCLGLQYKQQRYIGYVGLNSVLASLSLDQ